MSYCIHASIILYLNKVIFPFTTEYSNFLYSRRILYFVTAFLSIFVILEIRPPTLLLYPLAGQPAIVPLFVRVYRLSLISLAVSSRSCQTRLSVNHIMLKVTMIIKCLCSWVYLNPILHPSPPPFPFQLLIFFLLQNTSLSIQRFTDLHLSFQHITLTIHICPFRLRSLTTSTFYTLLDRS